MRPTRMNMKRHTQEGSCSSFEITTRMCGCARSMGWGGREGDEQTGPRGLLRDRLNDTDLIQATDIKMGTMEIAFLVLLSQRKLANRTEFKINTAL